MGDPWGYFKIHSIAKHQKIEGGPFGGKIFSESHNVEKNWKGDLLVSPGIVCYAEKGKTLFVQFSGQI